MSVTDKIKKTTLAIAATAALVAGATGVIGFSSTTAHAAGYLVNAPAKTFNFPGWDRLNIRAWPASHSQQVAVLKRDRKVFVERCIIKSGADWCKVRKGWKSGWVNGRFLISGGQSFSSPHHLAYNWH